MSIVIGKSKKFYKRSGKTIPCLNLKAYIINKYGFFNSSVCLEGFMLHNFLKIHTLDLIDIDINNLNWYPEDFLSLVHLILITGYKTQLLHQAAISWNLFLAVSLCLNISQAALGP